MHLTIRDTARYFHVDEAVLRRWITERDLPAHQVSERWHLNAIEVWEWAVAHGIPVSRRLLDAARHAPEDLPPLSTLLETGGIYRDIEGPDKLALLAAMVARLPLTPDTDREHLVAILEARELLGSTGIGDGIAIPHIRNPILFPVDHPSVSLFLLKHPVDFDAVDHVPVHAIFLVISDTVPSHLKILSRLGFALNDKILRTLLRERAPSAEILDRIRAREDQSTGQFPVAHAEP